MDTTLSKRICDTHFKDDFFIQCVSSICSIYEPPTKIQFSKIFTNLDKTSKTNFNYNKWLYYDKLKTKYRNIRKNILNNVFIDSNMVDKFIIFLQKYHFVSFRIQLLKHHYRRKKMKSHHPEFTLTLQSFNDISINKTIRIIEQYTIYHFSLYDLKQIILNALFKQSNLFIEPTTPKNPYTNLEISSHNLYSICVKMKMNHMSHPIIESYMKCHFNLKQFTANNYIKLQMNSIKTYLSEKSNKYKLTLIKQIYMDVWNTKFIGTFLDERSELQFINACYKLMFASIVLECFDTGCYTINDYYEDQLEKEMTKVYNTFHLLFSNKYTNMNNNRNRNRNQNQNVNSNSLGYSYYNYFTGLSSIDSYVYTSQFPIDVSVIPYNNIPNTNDNLSPLDSLANLALSQ